jgi:sugar phosphate isomerase/epimerase
MKLALHSVSYLGVWPGQHRLTVDEFIAKAAALGYGAVEFAAKRPHVSPLDYREADLQRLKRSCGDLGLDIVCLASYNDFSAGGDAPDMAHQQKELVYLRAALEMAAALGAPVVRVYTGYCHPQPSFWQQWRWVSDCIREAAGWAAELGVKIGVQNHSTMACHHEALVALMAEIGNDAVGIVLDAPTMHLQGESISDAVSACAGQIVHTHLSDFRSVQHYTYDPTFVVYNAEDPVNLATPIGGGDVDYATFLPALKATGYDAALSYEMCSPLLGGGSEENLDATARRTLEYVRRVWDAA